MKVVATRETVEGLKRMGVDIRKEFDALAGQQAEALRTAVRGNIAATFGKTTGSARGSQRTTGRTGNLSRSWQVRGSKRGQRMVGSAADYSRIHEYGGTIRPRRRKYLTIPIGDLTGSPIRHQGLRIVPMGGTLFFVDANGRPQYVLKRQVQMPKRPYVKPAVERRRPKMREAIMDMLREVKRRVTGGGA